ncbi:Uncharacterised protein [Enterococcus faecium]|nr:Uncharacterised protein [Enterococcus faecium]
MTILYFTATGNSLYVAKRLGGKLISIPQMIKENKYEFSDERIGIVFPVFHDYLYHRTIQFFHELRQFF